MKDFIKDRVDDVVNKIKLPSGLNTIGEDFKTHTKAIVTNVCSSMNLVTSEEFAIQTKVLAKTREKLKQIEKEVTRLTDIIEEK